MFECNPLLLDVIINGFPNELSYLLFLLIYFSCVIIVQLHTLHISRVTCRHIPIDIQKLLSKLRNRFKNKLEEYFFEFVAPSNGLIDD